MVTSVVPTGFSSSAALTLLQVMKTAASSNERFMTTKASSISAQVDTSMSSNTMFSILSTIAASSGHIVSTVASQTEQTAQKYAVQGDAVMFSGATATATMGTTNVQLAPGSVPAGAPTQVSVTTATFLASQNQLDPNSNAGMIQEEVENYVKDNSLSSQQISDALDSGGSIGDSRVQTTGSFKDVINQILSDANSESQAASQVADWLANGSQPNQSISFQSDDQAINYIASLNNNVASLDKEASGMTTAFKSGTLSFQKASDVQGLNYSETVWMTAFGSAENGGGTVSMNQDFLNQDTDGKQHSMFNVGAVEMYASW